MKAGIYARVSTEEQNADKQIDICKDFCKRENHKIIKTYKDIISGSTSSRPQFNQLLEDMREREIDCIVVTKLDRMGRSLKHLLSLFDEFQKRGIHFIAVTQH